MGRRSDSGRAGPDPEPTLAPGLRAEPGTALYVHVPYCVAKCTYCDFYSVTPERDEDLPDVVDLLLEEARARAPSAPRTVFVGGGTPSMLATRDLERLFEGLEAVTGFRTSAIEVTVECNPESLDTGKARRLLELGVDRLSLGFQSLDPAVLALFGRVHTAEQSFAAFAAAREAGCRRLSVDLIYGVPGQELATWEQDLARVLDLDPDHVSAYSLAFEEGTALTQALRKGELQALPEALDLAFFLRTRAMLAERGLDPYEVSNFSLPNQQCRHNELYWENGSYVGIGPGSVSYIQMVRFGAPRSVAAWARRLRERGCGASWEETLEPRERLGETWWLGLRTARGVDPARARARAGLEPDAADPAERLAEELGREGWLELRGTCWRLAARGLPLADALARRFLVACDAEP